MPIMDSFSTWTQIGEASKSTLVALLPIGAIEAHGPHLPLRTDGIIAEEVARRAAQKLTAQRITPWVLPALEYTPAGYAKNFPGTISISPVTMKAMLTELVVSLEHAGVAGLCLVSSHLDPQHIQALREWSEVQAGTSKIRILFPDFTRRVLAARLTEEFQKGSCHAGQFETSLVLAIRPELVRREIQRTMAAHWVSLPEKIKAGVGTFEEAGCPDAYCGDPAKASAKEGRATLEVMSTIVCEQIQEAVR